MEQPSPKHLDAVERFAGGRPMLGRARIEAPVAIIWPRQMDARLVENLVEGQAPMRAVDLACARVNCSRLICAVLCAVLLAGVAADAQSVQSDLQVPILVYHRFGPVVADSMTVTTSVFQSQLQYLEDHGYSVMPLRQFVEYRLGMAPAPPPRSVVITADDGHRSLYTDMLPIVLRYRVPVTLFIYPSNISRAAYALTWEQLREMQRSGFFDIQSHTYWHPNFRKEKKRLAPPEYEAFATAQLTKSRDKLHHELGIWADMLAWPFGLYDDELIGLAVKVGYIAAVTLQRRPASARDGIMTLPRYLVTNSDHGRAFERLLSAGDEPAR